jgi:hypothetical protein
MTLIAGITVLDQKGTNLEFKLTQALWESQIKCIIHSLKSKHFKKYIIRPAGLSSLSGITGSGTSFQNSGSGHTVTGKAFLENPVLVI